MADVLARIVARKRGEVAERLSKVPRAEPTRRSLIGALRRPGARFIMEVKPKSPSGHVARHTPDEAVSAYRHVADALSVLTDGPDFGGSPELLQHIRGNYGGPILAKDFIVDPVQVDEARSLGADAVLVMLSVLDDATAKATVERARRFAMDALVEVHDENELERALALDAALIGINNRDLKTLTTDLAVTERRAPKVPDTVTLISESGIAGHRDAARLAGCVDGFLVGSHLMAAPDIAFAARELVHGVTKLCGMTRVADVAMAARAGATHVGFIFAPGTPRFLGVERARTLTMMAKDAGLRTVGVFRGVADETIAETARTLRLDAVQIHEAAPRDRVGSLREALREGTELWGLAPVEDGTIGASPEGVDRTIFDTSRAGASGGTGVSFDWSALAERADLGDAMLAGGIGPDNVAAAAQVGAYGLDLCSGVEAEPGTKDSDKVADLFAQLRHTDRRTAR
ncbi:bifunctional indole-3-glycerol-phosphate synthase TrpC/phosphoribosylanthranilate isomerase TrpF [Sphingomicrobium sp. XHP0239]|uniref:bifunctional indole-3-glycerol-phosphate synthase TrpC/phosphoribosylanthranilate isomerase TrpF n=1 Tax=Sphingomicrobium maritimum TaxID=3133972 RepID=UPI0031CC616D